MSANVSSEQEKQLSPKQEKLIAELVAGKTIKASAEIAGIAEKTAHVWLKQPAFDKAYKEAKQAVFEESLNKLKDIAEIAIDTLRRNMTEAAPYVQVQAASKVLDVVLELRRVTDFEKKAAELEEMIKHE